MTPYQQLIAQMATQIYLHNQDLDLLPATVLAVETAKYIAKECGIEEEV